MRSTGKSSSVRKHMFPHRSWLTTQPVSPHDGGSGPSLCCSPPPGINHPYTHLSGKCPFSGFCEEAAFLPHTGCATRAQDKVVKERQGLTEPGLNNPIAFLSLEHHLFPGKLVLPETILPGKVLLATRCHGCVGIFSPVRGGQEWRGRRQ